MMKRLVCAVAAVGLIVTTCFSHLSAFAESKDGNLVIDLNASEDCETDSESLEDISNVPIIVYELGDPRVPVIDNDTMGDSNILEDQLHGEIFHLRNIMICHLKSTFLNLFI